MASQETGPIRASGVVIKRFRSDLLPPPQPRPISRPVPSENAPARPPQPAKHEPGPLRLMLLGAAGCVTAIAGALLAGIFAPVLIPGALAFLILAVVAPELVRGVGLHWPFRLLPRSYVAEPRRFAATLALVVIPISGIAGLGVYRSVLFDGGNGPVTPPPVAAMAVAPTETASIATPTAMAIAITPTPTQVVPTPTPATPSPTPSQAPTSAATPVPPTKQLAPAKLTAAQQSYLADLYAKWRIIDNSNDSYNQLIDQLQADTSLISNPAWQQQMTSQLAIWQSVYEAAKNGSAPAGLEIINGKWIEFLGHKNLAADKLSRGIKQLDIGLIDQGQTELDTAADVSWKLDGLLERFLAQFDGTTDVYSS